MATGYALFFCWLLMWQNCLFPTIQAVRIGAFHSAGSNAVVQGGQSAHAGANFDSMIHQFTGGDRELLSAIKQIASNTAQRVSFSLDGVIDHLIRMAPRMKEQSHKMVTTLQQRFRGQDLQQMFSHFLQKATGQSQQADEVMSILQTHQEDPQGSTSRLTNFVSGQDTFLEECIRKSRKLQAFIEVPLEERAYYIGHPHEYPDKQVQALFITTMVLLALWLASTLVDCYFRDNVRSKRIFSLLALFRISVVFYCIAYFAIMTGLTSQSGVNNFKYGYAIIGFIGGALSCAYAYLDISISFDKASNIDQQNHVRDNPIDAVIAEAVQPGAEEQRALQIQLLRQNLYRAFNPSFSPTIDDHSGQNEQATSQQSDGDFSAPSNVH
ncbi:hypothetical protein MP228_002848 [Amoeboaphelidium protococcarum]|nr:hypothetical protein MP228_002848 [Amoeboaphelidium protococcarum]